MSSFGQWYEEQKSSETGQANNKNANSARSSWFGGDGTEDEEVLPLHSGGDPSSSSSGQYTWSSMKSTMEAQMPQQILGMNYQQRFRMFCALLFLSALFFALAFGIGLPMIGVRPQKFALSFTCGSLTFMGSFGILRGPGAHLSSMVTAERLPFTSIYLVSMFATIYFTFTQGGISGKLVVLACSGCQLLALLWYLISFLPGGTAGLSIVFSAMKAILQPVIVACVKLQATCMQYCFSWMTREHVH